MGKEKIDSVNGGKEMKRNRGSIALAIQCFVGAGILGISIVADISSIRGLGSGFAITTLVFAGYMLLDKN